MEIDSECVKDVRQDVLELQEMVKSTGKYCNGCTAIDCIVEQVRKIERKLKELCKDD